MQSRLLAQSDELRFQATQDPLTGLLNRGAIMQTLSKELPARCQARYASQCDHGGCRPFKQINDTYGHLTGDQALIEVASGMTRSCRGYDSVDVTEARSSCWYYRTWTLLMR